MRGLFLFSPFALDYGQRWRVAYGLLADHEARQSVLRCVMSTLGQRRHGRRLAYLFSPRPIAEIGRDGRNPFYCALSVTIRRLICC